MKNKILKTISTTSLLLACLLTNVSNAGLITESYTGTVTSSDGTVVIGDDLTWSYTWDNTSGTITEFYSGTDQTAFTGDDIVHQTFNSHTGAAFVSDVSFDTTQLDSLFDSVYLPLGFTELAKNVTKGNSWLLQGGTQNRITSNIDGYGIRMDLTNNNLTLAKAYLNSSAQLSEFYIQVGNLTRVNAQVPEPSTLAIFALGMMGLASRRFKK